MAVPRALNMHLLTEGRVILGILAGNNGAEQHAFGYVFPDSGERLDQTEEAIRGVHALWTDSPTSFEGRPIDASGWGKLHFLTGEVDEVARELQTSRNAGVEHFQVRFADYPRPNGGQSFVSEVPPRPR
jgi:Luciferase-like monooxygenase